MKIYNVVRKNNYYDSVTLMLISKKLRQVVEGLDDVSVMMGTPANHVILKEAGLLGAEGETAGPNDLILAFRAPEDVDVDAVVAQIDEQMAKKTASTGGQQETVIHSTLEAYQEVPDSNLAVISVPGEYAAIEAERALNHGRNVFLFSDNVSVEEEAALKKLGDEKGLLVMGPDCGTAIINGVGIGFANKVQPGEVGLISASGTGLQEVTSLLDGMGVGVSQAIGTGGRDLKEAIGAATMLQALDMLFADEATKVITLISKPPAKSVVEKVLQKLRETQKKVVLCFIGAHMEQVPANVTVAVSLEDAACKTAALCGHATDILAGEEKMEGKAEQLACRLNKQQHYVRALYTGGTLCYEAQLLLGEKFDDVYSNIAMKPELKTQDVVVRGHHTAIDLGDDHFTMGRPHPMIDGSLRDEYILAAARDPETAVLLLDVVLGYGAAADPAGELVPVLAEAQQLAEAQGNQLAIIAYVCGTNLDPQDKAGQIAKLRGAGAVVTATNAQAVRMARMIADGGTK